MAQRDFPTSLANAMDDDTVTLAILAELQWDPTASPVNIGYFWSGVGALVYDSKLWAGAGEMVQIDKIADSISKDDIGVEITLNYLDDDIRNEVTTNDPRGNSASLYLALMTVDPLAVSAAYEFFPGFIDEVRITDSGSAGTLTIRLASELNLLNKQRKFQLSDAHQQYLFSGDLGMQFAARMNQPVYWGRRPAFLGSGGPVPSWDYGNWYPPSDQR